MPHTSGRPLALSLLGAAVLGGPAPLQHGLVQLRPIFHHGKEVDLPIRLSLGFLPGARSRYSETEIATPRTPESVDYMKAGAY